MPAFEILTVLCVGLMIGAEFSVSVFIHPVARQLENQAQAKMLGLFAGLLGKVMPLWYALSLVLILIEAWLRRREPGLLSVLIAAAIWTAVIVYSITALVPINNRIAALDPAAPSQDWLGQHKRWDTLHRWRIVFLVVAMIFLLHGIR